jgi:hypothetical protein
MKSSKNSIAGGCTVCSGSKQDNCKSIVVLLEKIFISTDKYSGDYATEIMTKSNSWREGKSIGDVTQDSSINSYMLTESCKKLTENGMSE